MMFYDNFKESRQKEVKLSLFSARTWRAAVNFIYSEVVDFSKAEVPEVLELLECAKYCQMDVLVQVLMEGVNINLKDANCCTMLMAALELGCRNSISKILTFLSKNFIRLCDLDALECLTIESLELVLKCDSLFVRSELDVLLAITSWLDANENYTVEGNANSASRAGNANSEIFAPRIDVSQRLTRNVRLSEMGADDLREVSLLARNSNLLEFAEECCETFMGLGNVA